MFMLRMPLPRPKQEDSVLKRKKDGETYIQNALSKIKRALVKFNPRTKDKQDQ